MSTVAYFRQLAAHDEWANRKLIEALRKMTAPPPRALEVISHIQGTQWTWLSRMDNSIVPTKVWPGMSLDDCERGCPGCIGLGRSSLPLPISTPLIHIQ